jgi:hypothetical protein
MYTWQTYVLYNHSTPPPPTLEGGEHVIQKGTLQGTSVKSSNYLAPPVYQMTYQMLLLMLSITHWASVSIAPSRHTDWHSLSHFLCPSPTCAGPHQSEAQFWVPPMRILQQLLSCQYLYFRTSKSSKVSTRGLEVSDQPCGFFPTPHL